MNTEPFVYRIDLSYKGTEYFGWQKQLNQKTVQGELEAALLKMAAKHPLKNTIFTQGSGRTDAGVHAFNQVVRVDFPFKIEEEGLARGLNSLLPQDIRVLSIRSSDRLFHPVHQAIKKEYVYLMKFDEAPSIFDQDYIAFFPTVKNIDRIKEGANLFVGKHDFRFYKCEGTPTQSDIREIYSAKLLTSEEWAEFQLPSHYYVLIIEGNGFLKQMVRLIVGTLVKLGEEKISLEDIRNSLGLSPALPCSEKRAQLAPVAPAKGLFLHSVSYPE